MQQASSSLLFFLQSQLNALPEMSKLFSGQGYVPSFPLQLEDKLKIMHPSYPIKDPYSANNLAFLAKQTAYASLNLASDAKETNLVKNTGFKLINPLKRNSIPKSNYNNAEIKAKGDSEEEKEPSKQVALSSPSKKISKSKKYRRSWSVEEDENILKLIKEFGQNWGAISKKIGGTRTGKQIRDRYLNKLDPKINNSKWTSEEDALLLKLYLAEGKKWCLISRSMPGRTEISVKNRFYSKYRHLFYKDGTGMSPDQIEAKKSIGSDEQLNFIESIASNKFPETTTCQQNVSFQNNSNSNSILTLQSWNSLSNTETEGSKKQVNAFEENIELSTNQQEKANLSVQKTKQADLRVEIATGAVKEQSVKIEEELGLLSDKRTSSHGMELENQSRTDNFPTVELATKLDQQISSFEELINSSHSGLEFLTTIRRLLQVNQVGEVGSQSFSLAKKDCCNMISSVMSNLSMLESNFSKTTVDTNQLLSQLILQFKE